MITTLSFNFLYYKPKLCSYVIHIMTHLHLANDFWNLKFLKWYFEFLRISSIKIFQLWILFICRWSVINISIFSHQFFFVKRVFRLVLYNIDFGVFKFKSFLLKPKMKLLLLLLLLLFEFFNIHINHLAQTSLINMIIKVALHKYIWKNWQFLNRSTRLLVWLIMIAPNFKSFV
jgi:hypothetical protein